MIKPGRNSGLFCTLKKNINIVSHKEQVRENINRILLIWLFARDAYYFAEYFYNPDTVEEKSYITNSRDKYHMDFLRHLTYRTLVIELSKLFKDSVGDKFNVFKFIRKLKSDGHHKSLKFDKGILDKWEVSLTANKVVIEKIVKLRDEYYAHEDDNGTDLALLDVGFEEIFKILEIVWDVIKTIEDLILDTDLNDYLSVFSERQNFQFLRVLAEADKKRTEEICKKYILRRE